MKIKAWPLEIRPIWFWDPSSVHLNIGGLSIEKIIFLDCFLYLGKKGLKNY